MEFISLDIDKYINWCFNLSLEIELLPINQERADRYAIASYYLFQRHLFNSSNKKSHSLIEEFSSKANKFQKRVDEYKIYQTPEVEPTFYIPTLEDWSTIKFLRKEFIDSDITELNKKLSNTPLPEMGFLKHSLNKLMEDRPVKFLNQYINVQPLPSACTLIDFVHDINTIDFAKYLHDEISQLEIGEQGKDGTKKRLPWKATKKDLSELIKALSLTAFAGIPEKVIIRAFESIIGDKEGNPDDIETRHYSNIKDYEHAVKEKTFTDKMNKAFIDFVNQKLNEARHNKK